MTSLESSLEGSSPDITLIRRESCVLSLHQFPRRFFEFLMLKILKFCRVLLRDLVYNFASRFMRMLVRIYLKEHTETFVQIQGQKTIKKCI